MLAKTDMGGLQLLIVKAQRQILNFENVYFKQIWPFELTEIPYPFIAHVTKDDKLLHYYVVYGAKRINSLLLIRILMWV